MDWLDCILSTEKKNSLKKTLLLLCQAFVLKQSFFVRKPFAPSDVSANEKYSTLSSPTVAGGGAHVLPTCYVSSALRPPGCGPNHDKSAGRNVAA